MARDFVLHCLRARFYPDALEEARLLSVQGGVNWAELLRPPTYRYLFPLLHTVLENEAWVPAGVRSELRIVYYSHAACNSTLLRELTHILTRFSESGIRAIVLKGGALAETVYGNAALRPMTDLDLLVQRDDLAQIVDLLARDGYAVDTSLEAHEGMAAAFDNELVLKKPDAIRLAVELHWNLLDSPYYQNRLPVGWFWETAQPSPEIGVGAFVLGQEALLIYLCAHLMLHHRGEGLLWQNDIAEVLHRSQDPVDWDLLLLKAAECDLVLPLQRVLPLVIEGWGAPVPREALERLCALQPSAGEVRVFEWLAAERRPVAQRFRADLVSMPGWNVRIRYGLRSLFPSSAYMMRRYRIRHRALLSVYYPYRWWRGLWSALPGRKCS